MRSGLCSEDFSGENTFRNGGKTEYLPLSVNPRFTDSVSLSVAFCSAPPPPPFFFSCLCRKLQESQDSMTSRLEEAEHKAQSLQTGRYQLIIIKRCHWIWFSKYVFNLKYILFTSITHIIYVNSEMFSCPHWHMVDVESNRFWFTSANGFMSVSLNQWEKKK